MKLNGGVKGKGRSAEEFFAALLQYYGLEFEYEPKTFVFERHSDGLPASAFTPDFYVPAWDTYVEITVQNGEFMWRKNRKVRKMKEYFPHVNVELLRKTDMIALALDHDREDLAQRWKPKEHI